MSNARVPDDERMPEALKRNLHDIWEQCEECLDIFIWDKIPDHSVLMETEHEQFWGAPCSYQTVVGFICPECGHRNNF
jgi:hypothetical protein